MPMWMSSTGSNSRSMPVGHMSVGDAGVVGGVTPVGSTQAGFTRPRTRSGTAAARISCLSAIDRELSIASTMSILSTELCVSFSTIVVVVLGSIGSIGRWRQPIAPVAPTTATAPRVSRAAPMQWRLDRSFFRVIVRLPFDHRSGQAPGQPAGDAPRALSPVTLPQCKGRGCYGSSPSDRKRRFLTTTFTDLPASSSKDGAAIEPPVSLGSFCPRAPLLVNSFADQSTW